MALWNYIDKGRITFVNVFVNLVHHRYNINTGALSRQLPTTVIFQKGEEVLRRPIPTKHMALKFDFNKVSAHHPFYTKRIAVLPTSMKFQIFLPITHKPYNYGKHN